MFFASAGIGVVFALMSALLLKHVDLRKNPSLEFGLMLVFTYAPYVLAEGIQLSVCKNMDDESFDSTKDQEYLDCLTSIRQPVNWESAAERKYFYSQCCSFIGRWESRLQNLREIFAREEIDWLLRMCVRSGPIELISSVIRAGYKDEPDLDKDGKPLLLCTTAVHDMIGLNSCDAVSTLRKLFEIYNNFNVNYVSESGLTHFHVACKYGCEDIVEKFLEHGQDPNCHVQRAKVDPPLHMSLVLGHNKVAELLLRRGADPNLVDAMESTALHHTLYQLDDDWVEKFFEICDDMQVTLQIDIPEMGWTPLHVAVMGDLRKGTEFLLRRGANPNAVNPLQGRTPLHIICQWNHQAKIFFEICDDMQHTIQIDVQDEKGWTPLHLALFGGHRELAEMLLRRGANPNLATEEGLTPLHVISRCNIDDDIVEVFFKICDEIQQALEINALDNMGNTSLHLALRKGNEMSVESLLRRGVDPNIANKEGSTPLHEICLRDHDDDLVKIFFEINKEKNQTVQIDSSDKFGRTPLNLAVTNLMPNTVDVLLDRGADLSSFVFPNYSNFCNTLNKKCINWDNLRLASGILVVVERLENREYQLNWNDALTIVKLFDDYRFSEKSWNLEECFNDQNFTIRAKKIIIIPSLSLYDLIQLRPEEEEKLLTYTNYFEIERLNNLDKIPGEHFDACISHLCEKMSRRYFQRLALDPLRELSRDRLPILCYQKIIEELKNEDLFKICQAGELLAKENGAKICETVSKATVSQDMFIFQTCKTRLNLTNCDIIHDNSSSNEAKNIQREAQKITSLILYTLAAVRRVQYIIILPGIRIDGCLLSFMPSRDRAAAAAAREFILVAAAAAAAGHNICRKPVAGGIDFCS
ncbi:unnamed protein product [Trichogramma brassicae]|uniref:Uncharacterized protein n=1 Tax=Trichogramma brassicae TaxID=86971 RepID=A0A6H5HW80_9HYME|nr:unnamed protein product [Trichogramma brassicae]